MAKTLEDEVIEILTDSIPVANVVDMGDVARRVIARVDEHRRAEREDRPHDGVSP